MPASNLLAPTTSSPARPPIACTTTAQVGVPTSPVTSPSLRDDGTEMLDAVLELQDGTAFRGISFGAEGKSVAGECVFQTGMSDSGSHDFFSDGSAP